MTNAHLSGTAAIAAPPDAVFAVLADPASHAAIDGTGWVRQPVDGTVQLTSAGQVFRMAMYHANHPDGNYQMANQIVVFDPPHAIAWKPGQDRGGNNELQFGGWVWRYDLAATGPSETEVTLSYDWSAVPQVVCDQIGIPPFSPEHLRNSLDHLAGIVPSAR